MTPMTPEEFEALVSQGDLMKIAEAVAPLSEAQRKKLSKTAARLYRTFLRPPTNPQEVVFDERWQGKLRAFELATMGVCPLSAVRKTRGGWDDEWAEVVFKVLKDRRPDWVDRWIENELSKPFSVMPWKLLSSLIREGIAHKPNTDDYIRKMATQLVVAQYQRSQLLSERLVDEPELLSAVWRLFEVEMLIFMEDPRKTENAPRDHESWTTALIKLSEQGHLDRQRLIDASLNALERPFKDQALTGYMRFHECLRPAGEELVARQQTYINLLAHRTSHVVTFALACLREIERAGRLDDEAVLAAVAPVFQIRSKV
jgi:hypothetical protein